MLEHVPTSPDDRRAGSEEAIAVLAPDAGLVPELTPVQLLAPDGSCVSHERYRRCASNEELLRMYESMVVTRRLDQEFINLQRQGELALYPSSRGQEAAQVGLAAALDDTDWMFPAYRELGAWIWRGVDPGGIAVMWRGTWHGGADLLEHASALISIPVGTQALHAVGYAMGIALDGADRVAVAFLGDGATSEGDVHEAMNFAGVYRTPCIFFVENNQWAISVPVSAQTCSASIAHKAVAFGMPGVRCDGNDVLATHAVVSEAVARARAGGGPTLIEAVTYRLEAHTTSDDPTRYRSDEEVAAWRARDPIARVDAYLARGGLLTEESRDAIDTRAHNAAQRLRESVVGATDFSPSELFDHVFVDSTPALREQREQLRAELESGFDQ